MLVDEFVEIQLLPYETLFGVDKPHFTLEDVRTLQSRIICLHTIHRLIHYTLTRVGGSSLDVAETSHTHNRLEVLDSLSHALALPSAYLCEFC